MTSRDDRRGSEHDRFMELAAIAVAGELGPDEMDILREHVRICGRCRQVWHQYRILAQDGFPMLAARYEHSGEETGWDHGAAQRRLLSSIGTTENGSNPAPESRPHLILRVGLAACLLGGVAVGSWRLGTLTAEHEPRPTPVAKNLALNSLHKPAEILSLAQTEKLARLQAESAIKRIQIAKLRTHLQEVQDRWRQEQAAADAVKDELVAARSDATEQLRKLSEQRDTLLTQFREASQALENMQPELARVTAERDRAMLHLRALEARVGELTAVNQDQEQQIERSEQYLSADREIHELMGARNLYIADVFDVDSRSRTRKPFGRVFYTREKSLIFYAFDLDRQPRVAGAGAFQVWGRESAVEGQRAGSLNLGILYLDSESNRRWSLRLDDPRTLARIDAVFVTAEPSGGSPKPTGRPFLYAILRREANHP